MAKQTKKIRAKFWKANRVNFKILKWRKAKDFKVKVLNALDNWIKLLPKFQQIKSRRNRENWIKPTKWLT